jgi:hypothetical protein
MSGGFGWRSLLEAFLSMALSGVAVRDLDHIGESFGLGWCLDGGKNIA